MTIHISVTYRNEQYQEELWKRSFEFLKDHLSPETVEKYGPPSEPPETIEAVATEAANETVTTTAEGTDVDGKEEKDQQT